MRVISRLLLLPNWLLSSLLFLVACGVTQEDACVYRGTIQKNPNQCETHLFCSKTNPKTPICDANTHKCVPCGVSSECVELTSELKRSNVPDDYKPVEFCVTEDPERVGECVPCTADVQCASKLCRTADLLFELLPKDAAPLIGECFPQESILHVDNSRCSMAGAGARGSLTNPYCDLSDAYKAEQSKPYMVLAVTPPQPDKPSMPYSLLQVPSGSVIVMRWPLMQEKRATNPVNLTGLEVGEAGRTAVALAIGVSILALPEQQAVTCKKNGILGLRDVLVSSQVQDDANNLAKSGVTAEADCSELRIERTHIDFFAQVGLWIKSGKFTVVNSAITRCGQSTKLPNGDPHLTGIYLDKGTAGNGTIDFSTIAKNPTGLYCELDGNNATLKNQIHYSIFSSFPYLDTDGCWANKDLGGNAAGPMIFSQTILGARLNDLFLNPSEKQHKDCCINKGPSKDITDKIATTDYFGSSRVQVGLADYGFYESPP